MVDPTIASKKTGVGGHSLVQLLSTSSTPAIGHDVKTTPADNSELPVPAIIGGAVGGLLMIVLVVVLVIYIWYRRKYPVRMVLGKDFQKFSNPAYNTKRMSALQLTSEDPLASYDEPLEQINEGFEFDREDRDSIFDDMPDGPCYLSHEPNRESKESGEICQQIKENHTTRQDSQESSTESERKNKKAILITSEQSESFVITNEMDDKSEKDEHVIQEHEDKTSMNSESSSESNLSYSVINEGKSNGNSPSLDRTVSSVSNEVTVNEYETRAENIPDSNEKFDINITDDLNVKREISLNDNLANRPDDKDDNYLNDECITEVNGGNDEYAKLQSETTNSSENADKSVDNSNETPKTEIVQEKIFDSSQLPSVENVGALSDSFFVLDSGGNFLLEDQFELVKETARKLPSECEGHKENNLETSISTRTETPDDGIRRDSSLDDEVPRAVYGAFDTTSSNDKSRFNENGLSPIIDLIIDNNEKDGDQVDISIDPKEDQRKAVDLEVLKLGYDLIKQSGISNSRPTSEEKLSPILSPENLVLERPPPTPTVIFDSIILEPDISSLENKFHSVPDVRIQRSFTMDDDGQPERRRARTSLDSSLNASLSDSFQSLISQSNREEKSELVSLPNTSQPLSRFEDVAAISSIESLTEGDSKTESNDKNSEANSTKILSLDNSKTTPSISYEPPIEECLNDHFRLNPYTEGNDDDTEFSLVIVDDLQSVKEVNDNIEKDVQSELTTSSESSSAKSWELIDETSSSLIDFNDKTEGNISENTGTKLLKIEPASFDFDNDSSEESKDYDEDSLEVINEDESNA